MSFFQNRIYSLNFNNFYKHSFFFFVSFYIHESINLKTTKIPLSTFSSHKIGESFLMYSTNKESCFNLTELLKQFNTIDDVNLLYGNNIYNKKHFTSNIKDILYNWYYFFNKQKIFLYHRNIFCYILKAKYILYLMSQIMLYKNIFKQRNKLYKKSIF